jgi:hypothetical protein
MSGKQGREKPEDTVSNADTGYETGSVVSASSSSQIMKVRHTMIQNVFMNFVNIAYYINIILSMDQLTHLVISTPTCTHTHTHVHTPTVV